MPVDTLDAVPPPGTQVPSMDEPPLIPIVDQSTKQELSKFHEESKRLDLHLRRVAGYGALVVAISLYAFGVYFAFRFSKPVPVNMQSLTWHGVVVTLFALFSVPTVLVLAVLRSAGSMTRNADADALHTNIGVMVMNLIDKLLDKSVDTFTTK